MTGTIKKIIGLSKDENGRNKGGFGFIRPDEGNADVFFHMNDVANGIDFKAMKQGDNVQFDITETDRGPKAVAVCYL